MLSGNLRNALKYHLLRGNYGFTIVLFTLLTKIILVPVSMWTSRNSLAMVSPAPELNRLKIKCREDRDTIAEETQALYKREHYHPLASNPAAQWWEWIPAL